MRPEFNERGGRPISQVEVVPGLRSGGTFDYDAPEEMDEQVHALIRL